MARLPNPGSDDNQWGDILNTYLAISLSSNGTLNNNVVGTNQIQNNAVTNAQLDSATQAAIASAGSKYTKPGGGIPSSDMTTAVQSSLGKADSSLQSGQEGAANGIATLDGSSKLTGSQLPSSVINDSRLSAAETGQVIVKQSDGGWAPNSRAQVIYVDDYGADPSGANDSTNAFKTAQAAGGSNPYLLVGSVGTYKLGSGGAGDISTFGRLQGFVGQGSSVTQIQYYGTGNCFKVYDPSFSSISSVGGKFEGFTLSGYTAASSAIGFSWGNMNRARCNDVCVAGFGGGGLSFKNDAGAWSEQQTWHDTKLTQNGGSTSGFNVCFDTGSYSYSTFEFHVTASANQDGLRILNGAGLVGVRFSLLGNFTVGTTNTAAVINVDPSGAGSSTFQGETFVDVESDGSTGVAHTTVKMAGGSSSHFATTGTMVFNNGTVAFQNASTTGSQFGHSGLLGGSGFGAMSYPYALTVQGGSQYSQAGGLSTGTSGTLFFANNDILAFRLSSGNTTLTFSGTPDKRVTKKDLYISQPASGAAGTITWPANVKWTGGAAPALSSTNGYVDKIRLVYLPSESSWYGELVGLHYA